MSRSQLNLRLDSELLERLRAESRVSGVPQAELVRRMLVERFGGAQPKVKLYPDPVETTVSYEPGPPKSLVDDEPRGFRCPLPACRHQQKQAGKCPRHGHDLVPVRL